MAIDLRSVPVHYSELKLIGQSPKHYKFAVESGRRVQPPTAAMRFGSCVDALTFGHAPVVVFKGKTRRGDEWEKFAAQNANKLIVSDKEYERAVACSRALLEEPEAIRLLEGERQKEIAWSFEGRACVSTLDVIYPGRHQTDLKTTRTVNPQKLTRASASLGYHGQGWFYGEAVKHAKLGEGLPKYIVAVESIPPFDVAIVHLTPSILAAGEKLIRSWFTRLLACERCDEWPGQAQSIIEWEDEGSGDLVFDEEDEAA